MNEQKEEGTPSKRFRPRSMVVFGLLIGVAGSAIGIFIGYLLTHWIFPNFENGNMLVLTENILTAIITALAIIAAFTLSGLWVDFEQRQTRHAEELSKKLTDNFARENYLALEKKGQEIKKDSKSYLWYGIGAFFTCWAAWIAVRVWDEFKKQKKSKETK